MKRLAFQILSAALVVSPVAAQLPKGERNAADEISRRVVLVVALRDAKTTESPRVIELRRRAGPAGEDVLMLPSDVSPREFMSAVKFVQQFRAANGDSASSSMSVRLQASRGVTTAARAANPEDVRAGQTLTRLQAARLRELGSVGRFRWTAVYLPRSRPGSRYVTPQVLNQVPAVAQRGPAP
jgi:hypothetical protein